MSSPLALYELRVNVLNGFTRGFRRGDPDNWIEVRLRTPGRRSILVLSSPSAELVPQLQGSIANRARGPLVWHPRVRSAKVRPVHLAYLEVQGDACFQSGLYLSAGMKQVGWFTAGTVVLVCYSLFQDRLR